MNYPEYPKDLHVQTLASTAGKELAADIPERPGPSHMREAGRPIGPPVTKAGRWPSGYKDPLSQVTGGNAPAPAGRGDGDCSWLGAFKDSGWSIKIYPRLTKEQWNTYALRADEAYDEARRDYCLDRAFMLLQVIFPDHALVPYCEPRPPKKKESK